MIVMGQLVMPPSPRVGFCHAWRQVRDSLRGLYLSTDNFNDNDVQLFFQLVRAPAPALTPAPPRACSLVRT